MNTLFFGGRKNNVFNLAKAVNKPLQILIRITLILPYYTFLSAKFSLCLPAPLKIKYIITNEKKISTLT